MEATDTHYDVIVIGAGTGLEVANFAAQSNLKVALVDNGPMGGTCLNRGCIPSKMLIHAADVAETIRSSSKFGITAEMQQVDFSSLVQGVSDYIDEDARSIREGIMQSDAITLYEDTAEFENDHTLRIGDTRITGDKIFIVAGSRPMVPDIPGLQDISYLTSKEALRLKTRPKRLVIVGGGYIAAELGHFFSALGTEVTLLVRGAMLLENEDSDISDWFTREFQKKANTTVRFNTTVSRVEKSEGGIRISLGDSDEVIETDELLLATGMVPNSDTLQVVKAGVELSGRGHIKINDHFKTSVERIWAFGDIVGIMPFKHTANDQVGPVIRNALFGASETVDYATIPHAVFSSPQVAGVGATEQQLKDKSVEYSALRYELKNTAMGAALKQDGLVKLLVDPDGKILGGHIVGPDASVLIHEVVLAMKSPDGIKSITEAVHVHPALNEWLQRAAFGWR